MAFDALFIVQHYVLYPELKRWTGGIDEVLIQNSGEDDSRD